MVTYEPGSALGRAGDLWPLRHTWHVCSAGVSPALRLVWVAAGWLLPAPGPAGWGESHTRRGCAGCTLCLSPAAMADLWGLLSAPAVNHCWCLPDTWFLEEQGMFLWLSDVWKFQCAAHRSEELSTPFLRLSRQSATELRLMLAHGGGHPRCLSS